MFATARIILGGGESAVFVPRKSIVRDKTTDSNLVYIADGGQARMRVVLVGEADGDSVRIQSGLSGNESVITNNQSQLFDGAAIQPK
jgi:multidrug efflux pump subunit AcrA (membrane-fusion protein)